MNSINITLFFSNRIKNFFFIIFFSYLASPKQSLFEHDWPSKAGAAGSKAIIRLNFKNKTEVFF